MTTLKKKIFHSKIQNIISENKFVLFFQFNNVKFIDWILLKNQIFSFKNINVIVIKNKISYKTFLNNQTKVEFFSSFNDSKLSFKINFLEKYIKYENHLPFASVSPCNEITPVANKKTKFFYRQRKGPQPINEVDGQGKELRFLQGTLLRNGLSEQKTKFKHEQSNQARFPTLSVTKFPAQQNKAEALPLRKQANLVFKGSPNPAFWQTSLPSAGLLRYNKSIEMYKNFNFNKEKLNFLCQGPTLVIYFNSINQCKAVYDILSQYTSNFFCTKSISKSEFSDSHKYKKSCLNTTNLPLLFLQKKSNLYLHNYNSIKKKNMKSTFFFIGGFFKGKIINHLDFEKLLQLNDSIYVDLITQYSNPVLKIFFFPVIVKIKFLKCFQNNLLKLLNVYKHNLKKIPV